MTPKRALALIEKAVDFYIRQNYEVAANMYQFKLARDDYARECFEKREELREAVSTIQRVIESAKEGVI
jgi:hypothetical protein